MQKKRRQILTVSLLGVCAVGLLSSVAVYVSYRADRTILHDVTSSLIEGIDEPSERVLALLHWVYDLDGSSLNPAYYLVRPLRATPVQVLEFGGDCADKSRLLYALLSEIDISSSMAMCVDETTGQPTHTLVEARIGEDAYMLVDPSYNLFFPDGVGGYYDIMDLRRNPEIVPQRINALLAQNPGSTERDRFYLSASTTYHTTSTINWHRNYLTKFAFTLAHTVFGENVYRVRRPYLLERPKLAVLTLWLFVSVIAGMAVLIVRRWPYPRKPTGIALGTTAKGKATSTANKTSTTPITA